MSGHRFGGRVPMYADDSDLDESPRHIRLQGVPCSRHGGGPHMGMNGEASDFEGFPPRTSHHGRRPSRHGGRIPGSRSGQPHMFGPPGLGPGMPNGGFDELGFAPSPRGHRHGHRAGHGPRGMPDFDPLGLRGDFGGGLGDNSANEDTMANGRHSGVMRGFDVRGLHGGLDDEDSDAELRALAGMGGPGRHGAVDEGCRGQGRRGTMEHGHEDFGLGDLDLGDRGHGSRHGPSRRHGHRGHRDMNGHEGNGRRHGRH